MKLNEIKVKDYQSAAILNESWQQLTEAQQVYVGRWETRVWPLVEQYSRLLEQELTPAQIQKIFTSAEQVAKATGKNTTALGKAGKVTAEVSGKLKTEIEKLMKQAGDSGPIKNVDAQFDKLKSQLATKLKGNPAGQKILQGVDKWKGFAEENPAKSAFIIGAMTSLLAFASGGIMSGAAIGLFIKLANNVIKGDKLSVALAKSAKGAAIGAVAGGLSDLIGDLVPPDVEDVIISSDGQTIDVSGLEGMGATGLEDLEPDAAGDLLKTQNALETALRDADGEARQKIMSEFEKVSDKVNELGGRDALADHAGLEGQDLERDTTTATDTSTGSEVQTVQAEPITAEELKSVGINFDTEPDISPEAVQFAEDTGIDPDQLQSYFQMKKALADAEFMGVEVSADQELASASINGEPNLESTTLPDGTEVTVGEKFTTEMSTTLPGMDQPFRFSSSVSIEGVDADGNPVFQIQEVMTSEDHPIFDDLDKLEDVDYQKLNRLMQEYSGVNGQADVVKEIDTFKQTLAKSIGAATTAVVVGGMLADKEVKAGAKDLDKKESIDVEELWDALDLYEANFADMIKKAKAGADKVTTAVARKSQQGVAAVKKGAASLGNELGNIVTAKKLNRMWTKAGKPTDMGSIVNILNQAGVSDEQIGTVGKQARVELSKPKGSNEVDPKLQALADEIIKLKLVDVLKPKLADG
jgi:hypothetical protein